MALDLNIDISPLTQKGRIKFFWLALHHHQQNQHASGHLRSLRFFFGDTSSASPVGAA
jgi:hypothetical protein